MWSERLRRLKFDSQYFRGFVDTLLFAIITSDLEGGVDRRASGVGVCLAKRDFVSIK
jgi:hypothetical protein